MTQPYKLKDEIKQFILEKKKADPKFSCRKIVPLIKEHFGLEISKSTINAIIKENSLSGKVGRPRVRMKIASQPVLIKEPAESKLELEPRFEAESKLEPVPELETNLGAEPEPKIEPELKVEPEPKPQLRIILDGEPVFEAVNFVSPIPEPAQTEEIAISAPLPKAQSIEIKEVAELSADIVNGGAIFLLMVDYKSGLTDFLAQKIISYLPDLSQDIIRLLIQSRVYGQIIKERLGLGVFLGKELTGGYLEFYYEQMAKIPLNQLNADFTSLGLSRNINDINMLYKECLLCLNRQVQRLFLPSVYQYLDFPAMCERFYSLIARVERKDTMIIVQFLYPGNFKAMHDIVWQEDFKSAVSALNKERIFTPEGKLFRFEEILAAYG